MNRTPTHHCSPERQVAPARRAARFGAALAIVAGGAVIGGAGARAQDPPPSPTPTVPITVQQQWNDTVGLTAASICPAADGFVADLVITWSTDNPSAPGTSFGLFGRGMTPTYASFNGAASGSQGYEFAFSAPTDLMVNMVWGMGDGNEQAYLTLTPAQQGECGATATAAPTTAAPDTTATPETTAGPVTTVAPVATVAAGGGNSGGGTSGGGQASATSASQLPETGSSTGIVVLIATMFGLVGAAVAALTGRRART